MAIRRLKNAAMRRSRAAKLDDFYALYQGGPVLDVGVSGMARFATTNLFMTGFRGRDEDYTGLGVVDLSEVAAENPEKRFVTYDGKRFPFDDGEFEWVFSNAVIEHVGGFDEQVHFAKEMIRTGRNVFFTTPNRYFPVEAHTNVLFLHWYAPLFFAWCRRYAPYRDETNLRLLSRRTLDEVMRETGARYEVRHNRFLGLTMTFTVVCLAG
jgi:SAM-dependent methyltransferase